MTSVWANTRAPHGPVKWTHNVNQAARKHRTARMAQTTAVYAPAVLEVGIAFQSAGTGGLSWRVSLGAVATLSLHSHVPFPLFSCEATSHGDRAPPLRSHLLLVPPKRCHLTHSPTEGLGCNMGILWGVHFCSNQRIRVEGRLLLFTFLYLLSFKPLECITFQLFFAELFIYLKSRVTERGESTSICWFTPQISATASGGPHCS